jgi:predicted MFS family arabinose efflux permease
LLREPGVAPAVLSFVLMYASLSLLVTYLPQWLTDQFAMDVEVFGHPLAIGTLRLDFIASLFLVGGVVSVVTGPKAGALSDTIGRKPLILASCLGLSVVLVLLVPVLTQRWIAYPFYCAIMGLFSLRMSPFQALMTELVSARQRGSLLALSISSGQIAFGAGAVLAGTLYTRFGFVSNTMVSAASVLAMAAVVKWKLPETSGRNSGRS